MHVVDPVLAPHPYVVQNHLRDLVLQDEHSPSQRRQIWNDVSKIVEDNANVRVRQVEQNGEDVRAWEWTGQVSGVLPAAASDAVYYPAIEQHKR